MLKSIVSSSQALLKLKLASAVSISLAFDLCLMLIGLWLCLHAVIRASEITIDTTGQWAEVAAGSVIIVATGYGSYGLWRRTAAGRTVTLMIMGLTFVGAVVLLLNVFTFFQNFGVIAAALGRHTWLLAGFALAYLLYRLTANVEPDDQQLKVTVQPQSATKAILAKAALGVALLMFVLLVIATNPLDAVDAIVRAYQHPEAWLLSIMALVSAIAGWRLLAAGREFGETTAQRTAWQGLLLLAPNVIGFGVFFAGPLLVSLLLSFTNATVGNNSQFTGLDNYAAILGLQVNWQPDSEPSALQDSAYENLASIGTGNGTLTLWARDALFWISLRNTLWLCVMLVPASVIPAFGLAILLNSKLRGMKVFRAIFFLPAVATVVGTSIVWRWLYDPVVGVINYGISLAVQFINAMFGATITDPKIEWLTDPRFMIIAVLLYATWHTIGFNMLLFLGGLQSVAKDLLEAATVDGANRWDRIWFVTLPSLRPTITFVVVTTLIGALQTFNEPYVLLASDSPTINRAGSTLVYYLYQRGFTRFEFGYSSALAWILFVVIFAATLIQFRLNSNRTVTGL